MSGIMKEIFDDSALQNILMKWPNVEIPPDEGSDNLLSRIRQVLVSAKSSTRINSWRGDMLPLIRQYLIRRRDNGQTASVLRFPHDTDWFSLEDLEKHGLSAFTTFNQDFIVQPENWRPSWLDHADKGAFADAFAELKVRQHAFCKADPFFTETTGHQYYFSPGQREAIRSIFLMKPGHTLIINLPTGSGKSLVGQLPPLLQNKTSNLTIFVVPTIALAMDQERQMMKLMETSQKIDKPWALAWHGSLSRQQRTEIRGRIRQGAQKILFTSPESLVTSLLEDLFHITKLGMLDYLVIDEAHLVVEWGDEFRPAFQALSGVRNALLSKNIDVPFRTLLMSATFTTETVNSLACLFGPEEKVHLISGVHLRPEPQYWFHETSSDYEKKTCLSEAISHAPRPFIFYVNRPDDARTWLKFLKSDLGLNRISCFHGETSGTDRLRIIQEWSANELDGIVATSAFGVGMDKNDVRMIIHADIPETLNRFYQEVGRGGRDGKASISLVVFQPSDWGYSHGVAKPKIISFEIGFPRWKAMYASKKATHNKDVISVDIEAVPAHLTKPSDYNIKWNMSTLLLMVRSKLIQLEVEPLKDEYEKKEFTDSLPSILSIMASIRVKILNDGHMIEEEWNRLTEICRSVSLETAEKGLDLLGNVIKGEREVSEVLAELYRINSHNWFAAVTRVCGGCPRDRTDPVENRFYSVPSTSPIRDVLPADFTAWDYKFPGLSANEVFIFFEETADSNETMNKILIILEWLISRCGIQEVCADLYDDLSNSKRFYELYRFSQSGFLINTSHSELDQEKYESLSRVTILYGKTAEHELLKTRILERLHHIIFVPNSTKDPDNQYRLFRDIVTNSISLQDFYEEVRGK